MTQARHAGAAMLLALLALIACAAGLVAAAVADATWAARRDRATERALGQAREALLAYAADRPIDAFVGPGYLPCPDADNDGWAESTCGSLDGAVGQAERLGRLPWKTLGLPDVRDGDGERLWYAVSTRFKGLLNCAASRACIDMTPPSAVGTITVRDASGRAVHDGTAPRHLAGGAGGAAAVVLAPGAALPGQRRECGAPDCDAAGKCLADPPAAAPRCDPRAYLEGDNTSFRDRSDAAGRSANADGFMAGNAADGSANDRLVAVGARDVLARSMARVALEAAHCLAQHAARNGSELPFPEPACALSPSLGMLPVEAVRSPSCNAVIDARPTWWQAWQAHVAYARGAAIRLVDSQGQALGERKLALVVGAAPPGCASPWLRCDPGGCTQARVPDVAAAIPDVLLARP